MSRDSVFSPIDSQQLEETLDCLIEFYDLVAVTLTSGDVLLGGISRHSNETVRLSFNSSDGRRFGHSQIIDIPIDLIADVSLVPLDDSSIPKPAPDDPQVQFLKKFLDEAGSAALLEHLPVDRLPVPHYPNPLASIIYDLNSKVASLQGLTIAGYVAKALSQDAIPPEGIRFSDDFLLYVDLDYLGQQSQGSLSVTGGINCPPVPVYLEISKEISKSLRQRIRQLTERGKREKTGEDFLQELTLQGRIFIPDPREETTIEGEKCLLCVIESSGKVLPALLKLKALKWPPEFLGHVRSVLTFYGESLPIPLDISGENYSRALLVRVIIYLRLD